MSRDLEMGWIYRRTGQRGMNLRKSTRFPNANGRNCLKSRRGFVSSFMSFSVKASAHFPLSPHSFSKAMFTLEPQFVQCFTLPLVLAPWSFHDEKHVKLDPHVFLPKAGPRWYILSGQDSRPLLNSVETMPNISLQITLPRQAARYQQAWNPFT